MSAPATIDEYLAAHPVDKRAALEKMREAIRAAAPKARAAQTPPKKISV
jgi:uncharacterized protein YdhG (YjbR/CyaY superfamily)